MNWLGLEESGWSGVCEKGGCLDDAPVLYGLRVLDLLKDVAQLLVQLL